MFIICVILFKMESLNLSNGHKTAILQKKKTDLYKIESLSLKVYFTEPLHCHKTVILQKCTVRRINLRSRTILLAVNRPIKEIWSIWTMIIPP